MPRNSSITLLVFTTLTLCATLPTLLNTKDLLQGSGVSQSLSYPENSSATYGNVSIGGLLILKCDPVRYGRGLQVESCRNVFNYMKRDHTETVFADRSSAQPHDLNLPFRVTSNNGRCYVQPILAEGAVTARASLSEVGNAAFTVFEECVVKRGMGGIAGHIGGDDKLNVIIASYKPDVRCNSLAGPPLDSCNSIFSNMHVDKVRQAFGHLPDQRVQVRLPITYTSADRRCNVKVDIEGEPTGLTLYEIWEAVVALTSTCVRGRQKCGKATGLGLGRNVFLQLSNEHNDMRIQPSSSGNQSLSLLGSNYSTST